MITRMELHAFTAFEHIEIGWSEGLNVLLGAGGAGKTHLLKVAGAGAGAAPDSGAEGSRQLGTRLAGAFGLAGEHIGMLVRRTDAGWAPRAHASVESNNGVRSIEFRPQDELVPPGATPQVNESARWIGTRIPATAGVGIEEGAVDNPMAGALERATGRRLANWKSIHVLSGPGEPEAAANPLASETPRRLTAAALAVDRLEPGTTVLWDNPETGIEAAARGELAQALLELAAGGAQVGIATHDYALLKEIDLASTPGQVRYHQPEAQRGRSDTLHERGELRRTGRNRNRENLLQAVQQRAHAIAWQSREQTRLDHCRRRRPKGGAAHETSRRRGRRRPATNNRPTTP